jgi:hypothetical protein
MPAIMRGCNFNLLFRLLLCTSIVCKCLVQSNSTPSGTDSQTINPLEINLTAIKLPATSLPGINLKAANTQTADPPARVKVKAKAKAKEIPKKPPTPEYCTKSVDHEHCMAPGMWSRRKILCKRSAYISSQVDYKKHEFEDLN